jgi:hypothetical protein
MTASNVSGLVNGARGEIGLVIDGRQRVLCLTLGALARLETGLGVTGLGGLEQRLRQLCASDMAIVIAALICDEGPPLRADDIIAARMSPTEAAAAIGACFEAAQ